MKKLFLLAFFAFNICGYSQSPELELESVKKRFENGEFSADQYQKMGKEWQRLLSKFGGYPYFPLNQETNEIEFVFVDTLKGFNKKDIYNRVMEFTAINYGNINHVLHYKDFEAGKIVIKGNFTEYYLKDVSWWISSSKEASTKILCDFTVEFTIKDEKLKTKITNPKITNFYYYNANPLEIELPLSYFYPITNFNLKDWENQLEQLLVIRNRIFSYSKLQLEYIKAKDMDYNF